MVQRNLGRRAERLIGRRVIANRTSRIAGVAE
jgi:hypothetical protein